jgi:hypothetical protein
MSKTPTQRFDEIRDILEMMHVQTYILSFEPDLENYWRALAGSARQIEHRAEGEYKRLESEGADSK